MILTYSHIQITAIPQLLDEEFGINMAEADRQIALAMSAPDLLAERDRLLQINAELAYALKGIIEGDSPNWLDIARAALTAAKGE